jgi:hypothetical protein
VSSVVVRATVPTMQGLMSEPPIAVTTRARTTKPFFPSASTNGCPAGKPASPMSVYPAQKIEKHARRLRLNPNRSTTTPAKIGSPKTRPPYTPTRSLPVVPSPTARFR